MLILPSSSISNTSKGSPAIDSARIETARQKAVTVMAFSGDTSTPALLALPKIAVSQLAGFDRLVPGRSGLLLKIRGIDMPNTFAIARKLQVFRRTALNF